MNTLTFFTRPDCTLCHGAWYVVERVAARTGCSVDRVDIDEPRHREWRRRYAEHIPVVHLDGVEVCRHRVDEGRLRASIEAAGGGDRASGSQAE